MERWVISRSYQGNILALTLTLAEPIACPSRYVVTVQFLFISLLTTTARWYHWPQVSSWLHLTCSWRPAEGSASSSGSMTSAKENSGPHMRQYATEIQEQWRGWYPWLAHTGIMSVDQTPTVAAAITPWAQPLCQTLVKHGYQHCLTNTPTAPWGMMLVIVPTYYPKAESLGQLPSQLYQLQLGTCQVT